MRFRFFRINQEIWAARRKVLDRGEEAHPSGLGETFLVLEGPPYLPVPLPRSGSGSGSGSEGD
jgi:hypothetical protein